MWPKCRAAAEALRRRRIVRLASGGAVAVAFVVFVTAAAQPSDHAKLDLADGEATSTTEVAAGGDAPSTSATSDADTTTTAPKGAGAGLRITAVLLDDHPIVDSEVHIRLTITDGDGSLTSLIADDYRDAGALELDAYPRCGKAGPSSLTKDVTIPLNLWELGVTYQQRRAHRSYVDASEPLRISISFRGTSRSGCGGDEHVAAPLEIALGFGNGTAPPRRVFDNGPPPKVEKGYAIASGDCDGILNRVEVDWGDGTPTELVRFGVYGCNDNDGPFDRYVVRGHEYAQPGTYTVSAVAISNDDQGLNEQRSPVSTFEHTEPAGEGGGQVTVL